MPAESTPEILQAIQELDDEQKQALGQELGPHLPAPEAQFSRRQFGGILAAVAGGSLSVQAALAAINEGVMPAAAADGVVNDIDTLQSGDGSAISVVNDLLPSTASGAALGSSSFPWSAITTDSLVIGGTLYEEDDNSPIDVNSVTSTSYTVSGDYEAVIIIPDTTLIGFDELQVNGDTAANYDIVDESGSETTGASQFDIPRFIEWTAMSIHDTDDFAVRIGLDLATGGGTAKNVYGQNKNLGGNGINSFTFSDSGSTTQSAFARVYGRSI